MDQNRKSGKRRRRQLVVNRSLQWRYALSIMFGVFVATCLVSCVLYGMLFDSARARMVHPGAGSAWGSAITLIITGLVFSMVLALALGIWSLLMTHRICGPLHVMHSFLTELAEGRFPKWRALRKRDEFKEVNNVLGAVVVRLKRSREREIDMLTDVMKTLSLADADHIHRAVDDVLPKLASLRADAAAGMDVELESIPAPQHPLPVASG